MPAAVRVRITRRFEGRLATELAEPALYADCVAAGASIAQAYEGREFSRAMREIMALADRANQYIDEKKPWALAKQPDAGTEVQAVCSMGLNLFRLLMLYLKPVLPGLAQVEQFLQIPPLRWTDAGTPLLDHAIAEFKPLMQRVDMAQITAMVEASRESYPAAAPAAPAGPLVEMPIAPTIGIEDFARVDLRVARIAKATRPWWAPTSWCGWNWISAGKPGGSSPASRPPTRRRICRAG